MNATRTLLAGLAAGLALAAVSVAAPVAAHAQAAPLTLKTSIPLPGYTGDFDHFAIDREHGRYLLAAEDHATLEVFDLKTNKHLKTIPGFGAPHFILVRPGAKTILVTDSDQMTSVLDANTLAKVGEIKLIPGADSGSYDAKNNDFFVVTGGKDVKMATCTLAKINPDTGKVLGQIEFKDNHVEAMAQDPTSDKLWINLAQTNQLAVVDRKNMKVLAMWPITSAKQNAMVAFDAPTKRLFVVARDPGMVIVLDSDTGKVITTAPAPLRADEVIYSADMHKLYVPGGEGYIGVYDTSAKDKLPQIAKIPSQYGAKTGTLLPDMKEILIAASPGDTKNLAKVLVYSVQ